MGELLLIYLIAFCCLHEVGGMSVLSNDDLLYFLAFYCGWFCNTVMMSVLMRIFLAFLYIFYVCKIYC